ncbi:tetratricopeptide repeat protein [Buchnera aphidicola (Taiwanaphis decaspermi)]|uniref:transglutaminase family protein n=1 Tax=Buchnera aphidicola TaxID=9 RepID=UPI0031B846AD
MKYTTNINFSNLTVSESIIETFKFIKSDFSKKYVLKKLNILVNKAKVIINKENTEYLKIKKLLYLFYNKWNFKEAKGIYNLSDVIWLDNVLKNKNGTGISLGILLLHIANKLSLNLMPVIFPTQLILKYQSPNGKIWLINPFNGETLDKHILKSFLKGNISINSKLYLDYLNEADNVLLIIKILDTLKSSLIEEKKMELALNVSNFLLQIDPTNPYEIRDRGLIYSQLDCDHVALNDLMYFIENCPDDPISEIIKFQIYSMEYKKLTLH